MQIPLLHQQILLETERLRDLHRSVMSHNSPVPATEMENLLEQIRKLYSLVLQLNNENAIQLLNEIQLVVARQMPQTLKTSIDIEPEPEPVSVNKIIPEEIKIKTSETKITESVKQPSQILAEKPIEKKRLAADIHEMYQDTPTLADKFSDHQTLAEKIAGNGSVKRVSDNLKTTIKDIKSAIGINEKFQFINQLFNGDAKNYHAVIDKLNSSISQDAALNHIREISDSNNWEQHPATAKLFIEIIERRFSV